MFAPVLNPKSATFAMVDFGLSDGRSHAPASPRAPRLVAGVDLAGRRPEFSVAEASLDQMDAAQSEWTDLATRAIEPNAFYEPGFALAAALHFPVKTRPRFIAVWGRAASGARRMAGLFPIVTSSPFVGDGFIRLWLHKQAALATPLVDRDDASAVIEAFLAWIEERSFSAGVVFSRMHANGRFHEALTAAASGAGRRMKILDAYDRAALLPGGDADELCARAGSRKKLGEVHRQGRRLREMGRLTFHSHETADEIRLAAEEFMALEASGWKAGRGAFLSQPSLTTFLRSATRLLAHQRRCKIQALRLDGRPIAMAIVLESQGRSYCWKTAFDERLRAQAPGIQLVYEQTKAHLARPDLEMADSCAIANHPMIDRLWPDRVSVCDLAVQLQTGCEKDFLASCRRDHARRQIHALAKRAANRLLKRKVS